MTAVVKQIPKEEREKASRSIVLRIADLPLFADAATVLGFVPLASEVDISALLDEALLREKTVALPRCLADGVLSFHYVDRHWRSQLMKGEYGIQEPLASLPLLALEESQKPILAVIPGLAFSPYRQRLGRGKGYYDRLLARRIDGITVIGVCMDVQIVLQLPVQQNDQLVDIVVTERALY